MMFFIFTSFLTLSNNARTWWDTQDYDYNDSIDYPAIRRIIEQEMDRLFQPHFQTLVNRNYLNEMKEYAKNEISKTIKTSCSTHTYAKKLAIELTEEFAVDLVVEWAAYIAREMVKNPPLNPIYVNQQEIIATIKQIVRSQAEMALKEKDRRLTKIVQNITENVELLVDQEFKLLQTWY